ncbi:hypothetical protein CONLIGDRAFT_649061 [Coniochaeta ligniaria NRRL 30616]|uniref:Uncharacterized protein n=1 Tax=Coniochaeta ligniaria NRRL 30616 TaxID=1408157 RepID=A0A1J7I9J1_9PEZI|nr:hypothetical protein CONLIGDRAFT_649061 [Coniochaeta ligniaria NRRL 30616]
MAQFENLVVASFATMHKRLTGDTKGKHSCFTINHRYRRRPHWAIPSVVATCGVYYRAALATQAVESALKALSDAAKPGTQACLIANLPDYNHVTVRHERRQTSASDRNASFPDLRGIVVEGIEANFSTSKAKFSLLPHPSYTFQDALPQLQDTVQQTIDVDEALYTAGHPLNCNRAVLTSEQGSHQLLVRGFKNIECISPDCLDQRDIIRRPRFASLPSSGTLVPGPDNSVVNPGPLSVQPRPATMSSLPSFPGTYSWTLQACSTIQVLLPLEDVDSGQFYSLRITHLSRRHVNPVMLGYVYRSTAAQVLSSTPDMLLRRHHARNCRGRCDCQQTMARPSSVPLELERVERSAGDGSATEHFEKLDELMAERTDQLLERSGGNTRQRSAFAFSLQRLKLNEARNDDVKASMDKQERQVICFSRGGALEESDKRIAVEQGVGSGQGGDIWNHGG